MPCREHYKYWMGIVVVLVTVMTGRCSIGSDRTHRHHCIDRGIIVVVVAMTMFMVLSS